MWAEGCWLRSEPGSEAQVSGTKRKATPTVTNGKAWMRATGFRQRPRGGGGGAAALGFRGGPWCWFWMASCVNSVSADVHVIANLWWISHAELDDFLLLLRKSIFHTQQLFFVPRRCSTTWTCRGARMIENCSERLPFLTNVSSEYSSPKAPVRSWRFPVGYDVVALTHTLSGKLPADLVRKKQWFYPLRASLTSS